MERMKPEAENIFMVNVIVGEPLGSGSGSISAAEFDAAQATELAETISRDYMVDATGPGCCIDGRNCVHTLAETAPQVGPSVAGGPTVTAYAAAELVGDYFGEKSAAASLDRVEEVNQIVVANGIALGAHVSKGALDKTDKTFINPQTKVPETGCGASDEFKTILTKPTDEKKFVDDTTALLLGEEFNPDYMQLTSKETLQNRVEDYNSRQTLDSVAEQSQGTNVEVLEGTHAEVLVVFNYVKGKTVDRDSLVAETGKQVFVIDMWYVDELAHAMAAGRPDAPEMYGRLKHAMTAFQVATYLTLCDGTHRPVILKAAEPALSTAQ